MVKLEKIQETKIKRKETRSAKRNPKYLMPLSTHKLREIIKGTK
jgi:hypothetical protein